MAQDMNPYGLEILLTSEEIQELELPTTISFKGQITDYSFRKGIYEGIIEDSSGDLAFQIDKHSFDESEFNTLQTALNISKDNQETMAIIGQGINGGDYYKENEENN